MTHRRGPARPGRQPALPGRPAANGTLICLLTLVMAVGVPCQGLAHPDLLAQIEALGERLRAEPANAQLLLQRGDLHRRHEDYEAAERDLAAARRAGPEEPLLDLYEGRLRLEMGDASRAASLLGDYLLLEPEHALGWRLHGEALASVGHFERASASFGRAIFYSTHPGPELFQWQVMALLAAQGPGAAIFAAIDDGLRRFGQEVTLLGLGVDLALGEGLAERARNYLDLLPRGLERLPAWQARLDALECLADSTGNQRRACLRAAQSRLKAQIATFEQKVNSSPAVD